jgi:hypothetical protein
MTISIWKHKITGEYVSGRFSYHKFSNCFDITLFVENKFTGTWEKIRTHNDHPTFGDWEKIEDNSEEFKQALIIIQEQIS